MAATSRFLLDPIGSGAMALRPPSYFAQENPSIKDPSEEREVLAELTALREENVKLKKELRVDRSTEEESVASNFVPLAEFVRMKTQLQECIELLRTENGMLSDRAINLEKTRLKELGESQKRMDRLVSQEERLKGEYAQEVACLQAQWQREADDRVAARTREVKAKDIEVTTLNETITHLKQVIIVKEEEIKRFEEKEKDLVSNLQLNASQLNECTKTIGELTRKITSMERLHEAELSDCHRLLAGFQGYLGISAPPKEDFTWKEERANLLSEREEMQHEMEQLKREVDLTNTRLKAVNEMLLLQEMEVVQDPSDRPPTSLHPQPSQSLLKRWREKVFELLVQLKSQDLDIQRSEALFEKERVVSKREHDHLKSQIGILSCTLEDKTAEVRLEQDRKATLERKVESDKQQFTEMREQCSCLQQKVSCLSKALRSIPELITAHRQSLSLLLPRIAGFERRLKFACERLRTLDVLRQNAPPKCCLATDQCSKETQTGESTGAESCGDLTCLTRHELVSEVGQLSSERHCLVDNVAKLKESCQLLQTEIDTLRNTLEEKVSQFAHQNAQLGEQLQMTVSECEQLRVLVSQTSDERDHLKVLLDQLNADTEQSVHRAVMEERRRLEEEFAQMESHLNDARREQTKMAVALKQCQRTAAVEREQLLASVELEREHLHQELEQNKAKLGSVLAERNLMINALRSDRGLHLRHTDQNRDSTEESEVDCVTSTLEEKSFSEQPSHTPSSSSPSSSSHHTYVVNQSEIHDSGDGDGDGDGGGDGDGDGEIAMSLELQCALKEIQNISKGILNLDKLVH